MKSGRFRSFRAAPLTLLIGIALSVGSAKAADLSVVETGSTLMQPLIQNWADAYAKVVPEVKISTAGTGSGAGIAAAIDGKAQLGASDAYMSDLDVMQHPGILNVALAISAQTVNYNIPNISAPLRLTGPVLASIYAGVIHDWNDPKIAAINPGVTLPPQKAIVPVRRSDASGDTFIFTQFLTFSTPAWESGPGYGTTVVWPVVQGVQTAANNLDVVKLIAQTPYSIGYVGGSFADAVAKAELGTAVLQNESGQFVLPTTETVTAAAAALTPRTPADQRLTLAFAPGDKAYPLINYEYAMVRSHQSSPEMAAVLREFLLWTVMPGEGSQPAYLAPLHFIPLPTSIRALTEAQIAKIQ